jgi:4-carboxymuconolactone decarboxylase
MSNQRYEKGRALFEKIHGSHAGEQLVKTFGEISPELERFSMEWGFNDILSRTDKLDLKTRELIIIAALTTQGDVPMHLRAHIEAARNVGATQEEITETILQLTIYASFPRAVNAMLIAKEVFEQEKT